MSAGFRSFRANGSGGDGDRRSRDPANSIHEQPEGETSMAAQTVKDRKKRRMTDNPGAGARIAESSRQQQVRAGCIHRGRESIVPPAHESLQLPEPRQAGPMPIWFAALSAAECRAVSEQGCQPVRWDWAAGRAFFTNSCAHAVHVLPLNVLLQVGETLTVTWISGDSSYAVKVYDTLESVA